MDYRNKMCHLCGQSYTDDPILKENPGHTPEQCLAILRYWVRSRATKLMEAESNLKRAETAYKTKDSSPAPGL